MMTYMKKVFLTYIYLGFKIICIFNILLVDGGNLKGVPLPKGKMRIVGGKSTNITKYPFIVSIQAKGGEFPGHICGGSLLNEIWVVTAAHCVIDVSTGMPNYAKDYFVLAGKTNINTIKQDGGLEPQRRDIVAMMPHRNFFIDIQADDIALILLSSAIKEAPNIKYAKLPKTKSTKDDVKGPCTAIGWGKLHGNSDNYDAHPLLQHVVLDVISTVECMKLYERGVKIGKSICTFTPGKDACQMDSGGPLVCGKADVLYGITSFGEGCAGTKPGDIKTVKISNSQSRIVGGYATDIVQYPFIVSIQLKYETPPQHVCGGSLLNQDWVLTAAHCIINMETGLLEASTDYIVVAGKTDVSQLKKEGDLEHQIRDVIAIIPHSDFRKALFAHDIALLLVSHPIKQAPNIKYVKVPKHLSQDDSPDVRGPCTAIGWGKLNFSSVDDPTPPLRAVKLDVFPTKDCQKIHQRLAVKRGKTVCTYSEGKDSCSGDSGGPLVCGPDDIQEGVTSFGQECAGKLKPGVFVRVAGYLRWIKNTVSKDKRSLIQDEDYRSLAPKYHGAVAVVIITLIFVL